MAKRMILMLVVMALVLGGLGFAKFRQVEAAIAQGASFQLPPTAVTTVVAQRESWPSTLSVIGTAAAIQGVTVSADLPFAQARFCGAEGVDKLECASDHRDVSFGKAYGVLIKEGPLARILTRSIFVVGPDGTLKHVEYVPEISSEPNYDAALAAIA